MANFQKSVIQKHLSNLNKELVEKAYQRFRENYNPTKIEKLNYSSQQILNVIIIEGQFCNCIRMNCIIVNKNNYDTKKITI